jgi:hypothetical protein
MKDWLTDPDPPDPIALQLLKVVCRVILGIAKVLLYLWPLWI